MFTLTVEETISSAHQLREYSGKCERIHGHNWRVVMSVSGKTLNRIGLLIDFHELKDILRRVCGELDHVHLNEVPPFDTVNPSSEQIACHIAKKAAEELYKVAPELRIESVTVYESDTARCTYTPGKNG